MNAKIVDFCFNPAKTHLFVCCSDGKVSVRDASSDSFTEKSSVQLTASLNKSQILCFNDQTLMVALDTTKVVSVTFNTSAKCEEMVFDLEYKIKNLILVDNCVVAQQVDAKGKTLDLCRFVPRY